MFFKDVSSLIQILNELNSEKLLEIKNKMSEIAKRRYIWRRISGIYQNNLT